MAKTDQELAQEEMASRQYMYGGTGPFSQFISGERREILSPESTQVLGFASGPSGVEYITETIPAQYGPAEYDPSYSPVRRGLSALGDMLGEAPSFLGFRGPDEQAEAIQGVGSSLRDALFGTSEYMSEQARAAASGGEYFDPEAGRIVAFDPTITMFGGNPAEGAVMGSGFRMRRQAAEAAEKKGLDTENIFLHGTSDDIRQPTSSRTGARDSGWLGEGFYGATPEGSRISDFYANTAAPRFRNEAGDYSEPNVFPYITRRGNYKQYSLMDKAEMGVVAQMNPNYSKKLTQKNIDEGFIGADVVDADGNIIERVNYFPDEDTRSVFLDADLYSGGGRTGTGIASASALRNELERQFGGPIPEVTRDTELLMRVGDPRSVNEMVVEMTDPLVRSAPIIGAEDLIDRPFITGMSDTSRSGLETVTSVNNVPLNAVMRGGKYFGLQPQNLERGIAFASAPGAVMGQLNRAAAAQALGGRPVAFIPFGMRPASPDFATMSTDIMVPYAQQVMSRSDKIALDRRIREGKGNKEDEMRPIPDWVGIDNATPEYLKELGGDRKAVTKALDEFRDAGSLSRSQARAIVTDPTQFEPVFGDIDMIYELDPQAVADRRFLDSNHPSYESALLGRPLGALRDTEKVNIFEFNPLAGTQDKGFYNFRQKQLDAGRDFPIGGSLSSPTMKAFLPGGHGIITREMVDDLIRRGLVRP
jgi:hypothetical protein